METGAETFFLAPKELRPYPLFQIEWLANGDLLATQSPAYGQPYQIWRFAYPNGDARMISKAGDDFYKIRVSADGKTLVAEQTLGSWNIWTAPADNFEKKRQITVGAAARQGARGLAYMPDGKIVYASTESGAIDLWLMNEDGSNRRNLTAGAGTYNYSPQPTADGRYIVFGSRRSGTHQVWRMDADGGNPTQLSKGIESWDFSISPENEVYYNADLTDGKQYPLFKVSIEGGEPIKINDFSQILISFSPDGKWFLYYDQATPETAPRYGLMERATGKTVRYLENYGFWSPDSKSFFYKKSKELWRQPIEGGEPQKIYDFSPNSPRDLTFSPDGKKAVSRSATQRTKSWRFKIFPKLQNEIKSDSKF